MVAPLWLIKCSDPALSLLHLMVPEMMAEFAISRDGWCMIILAPGLITSELAIVWVTAPNESVAELMRFKLEKLYMCGSLFLAITALA